MPASAGFVESSSEHAPACQPLLDLYEARRNMPQHASHCWILVMVEVVLGQVSVLPLGRRERLLDEELSLEMQVEPEVVGQLVAARLMFCSIGQ